MAAMKVWNSSSVSWKYQKDGFQILRIHVPFFIMSLAAHKVPGAGQIKNMQK